MLLFELFPWFYLVAGFTIVDFVAGVALFIADRQARRADQQQTAAQILAEFKIAA